MNPMPPPLPVTVVPRENSVLAIVSLVAGILGWTLLPFIGSLGAIICGHLARAEIRREPLRYSGDGMAIGGLILGYASVLFWIAAVFVFVLFFGGLYWLSTL